VSVDAGNQIWHPISRVDVTTGAGRETHDGADERSDEDANRGACVLDQRGTDQDAARNGQEGGKQVPGVPRPPRFGSVEVGSESPPARSP
jgi:hypothetical protein